MQTKLVLFAIAAVMCCMSLNGVAFVDALLDGYNGDDGSIKSPDEEYEACSADPNSPTCATTRDQTPTERAEKRRHRALTKDQEAVEGIVNAFESTVNRWCCSTTRTPLFTVKGDHDVSNFIYTMLSQALRQAGQSYGAELVMGALREVEARQSRNFSCPLAGVEADVSTDGLPKAVKVLQSHTAEWLRGNQVAPEPILELFAPQLSSIVARWGIGRLQHSSRTNVDVFSTVSQDAVLGILSVFGDDFDDDDESRCQLGSQLHQMYRGVFDTEAFQSSHPALHQEIDKLLEECFANGLSSAQPHVFGEPLLDVGRETEARQLFDLSVKRGAICHPLQRPEMMFRKDLRAQPFWPVSPAPEGDLPAPLMEALDELRPILTTALSQSKFIFSGDSESMAPFLDAGAWERTIIYGDNRWQEFNCLQFGRSGCDLLHRIEQVITSFNDAYHTQCNGSLVMDIWRLMPGTASRRSVGPANIVLQLVSLVEVRSEQSLLLSVGGEAAKVDEGETILMDDSFENTVRVISEESEEGYGGDESDTTTQPKSSSQQPLVAFHIQLCHPDLHDKAYSMPPRKCKKQTRAK